MKLWIGKLYADKPSMDRAVSEDRAELSAADISYQFSRYRMVIETLEAFTWYFHTSLMMRGMEFDEVYIAAGVTENELINARQRLVHK